MNGALTKILPPVRLLCAAAPAHGAPAGATRGIDF